MATNQTEGDAQMEAVAASFRAAAHIYGGLGSPLYEALCINAADDPDIVSLASNAMGNARPIHVFTAVHYLLLRNPDSPLSRYFRTLTEDLAPPDKAYPAFARYCAEHRDEILQLMKTHTVQMTFVERCRSLVAPMSLVAAQAGEPLNLVEIGCAAGVLLTFDKYAYDLDGRGRIGPANAPVTLSGELRGGPSLRIPKIGTRTGLDLHTVNVNAEDERRWILASTFPELHEQQARLATALDVVAETDITMLQGDALDLLPGILAATPSPLCVYHSACLMYWSADGKAALNTLLMDASRDRDIYRVGLEPTEHFDAWSQGRSSNPYQSQMGPPLMGEVTITRYSKGTADSRLVARQTSDYGTTEWID
jgi:hypothetical protein